MNRSLNAPVTCKKPVVTTRAGFRDPFHVVRVSQRLENQRVLTVWAARFADRNLREEVDEMPLTKTQLSGRRIVDRPGDEASRRTQLARGCTL